MICDICKAAADKGTPEMHDACRGGTHCDCRHGAPRARQEGGMQPLYLTEAQVKVMGDAIDELRGRPVRQEERVQEEPEEPLSGNESASEPLSGNEPVSEPRGRGFCVPAKILEAFRRAARAPRGDRHV